jgi:hypothetical protein
LGVIQTPSVNAEVQKVSRPRFTVIEVVVGLLIVYLVALRLTVLVLVAVLALSYFLYPWHRSRQALAITSILLLFAVLVPIDVYVGSFHGQLYGSSHSGPRMVRVVWGMPMIQRCLDKYGEFIAGGCVVRVHDTRWMLVCD